MACKGSKRRDWGSHGSIRILILMFDLIHLLGTQLPFSPLSPDRCHPNSVGSWRKSPLAPRTEIAAQKMRLEAETKMKQLGMTLH